MDTLTPNQCLFCHRHFGYAHNLKRHLTSCKEKKKQEAETQEEIINRLQADNNRLQTEVLLLREQFNTLQNHMIEIAKQPTTLTHHTTTLTTTTNNQRTMNIINQLGEYNFEEERVKRILEQKFTQDVFLGGPDKIAEFTATYLLTDPETQKPRVVCTDVSRKVYRYVDPETRELQVDPGFQRTHKLLKRPLEQANLGMFYDQFLRNDPDDLYRDQWKKNDEFIEDPHRFPDKLHQFLKK